MDSVKNDLKKTYDSIATEFSASRAYHWPELEVFIPYILHGFKVLDLGCGNGRLIKVLDKAGLKYDYLGIDFSQGLIDEAKKNFPDKNFMVLDMADIDFKENSFDLVLMGASFHHLSDKKQRQALLKKINHYLKPGGYLFMTNWNLWQRKYLKYFFKNFFKKKSLRDFFIPYTLPDKSASYLRYYHSFSIAELEKLLLDSNFVLEPKGVYKSKFNINALVKKPS
ncbi:MAG: class I SAM-dependent methyltransferase [bacterium]|nr:class I SAM-dependent methyltransferase [bacterium]